MTQTTDTDGGYLFTMLPPDDYTVKVDQTTLPAGMSWTGRTSDGFRRRFR